MSPPPYPPRATLRLQFNHDFTMDAAVAIVDWAADVGISHFYASPLLTARAGSTHGYDIVDHDSLNPELGGEPALQRLVAALRARGMGLILDIVPNHMGVGGHDNAWWLDVLEWGRASPYAEFFDIDFEPPDAALRNKVMAPFLGEPYGACLERGEIVLRVDAERGSLDAWYHDHRFPIRPVDYATVLTSVIEPATGPVNRAAGEAIRRAVREAAAKDRAAIDGDLARFAADAKGAAARLHALLERQHFRLVWWRAAADEINWRRFFDINTLAGIRVEVPRVFDATHARIFQLYADGLIDGVRIDHVDGLAEPRAYCRKLRRRLAALTAQRPAEAGHAPPLIWVEKILAHGETLPTDWMVDGTTGYDFMDQVGALLHDPAGEAPLTRLWADETGRPADFRAEEYAARRQILHDALASELYATAAAVHRIARQDPATRDLTLTAIRHALIELLVHFPVYRLYAGPAGQSASDQQVVATALAGAIGSARRGDRSLLNGIAQWLAADPPRAAPVGHRRQERHRARVRFQQLSAPTAAKSVEDTAFYRYGRLLSRNEVGSDPAIFATSVADFHADCAARLKAFPRALLATATHDHKRGEDVRARLAVLSEWPEAWRTLVARIEAVHPRDGVDPADRLTLLQMLVGAWPLALRRDDETGVAVFRDRIAGWQQKALREAKLRTDWAAPDSLYEAACHADLEALLARGDARAAIADFAERLAVPGAINALSQTFLRLTTPGIPDLYQGAVGWDLSLVDPDNRRLPDFAAWRAALRPAPGVHQSGMHQSGVAGSGVSERGLPESGLPQRGVPESGVSEPGVSEPGVSEPGVSEPGVSEPGVSEPGVSEPGVSEPGVAALSVADWRDDAFKQALIARVLQYRQAAPEMFADARYQPVEVVGPQAAHVVAFLRTRFRRRLLAAAVRLPGALVGDARAPVVPPDIWRDTQLVLPAPCRGLELLTGREIDGAIMAERLFAGLPVALIALH